MSAFSVKAGSKVTVKLNGKEQDLTIVDPTAIDPSTGHISFNSPIAQSLLGTEPGDVRELDLPNGSHVSLEIVSVG